MSIGTGIVLFVLGAILVWGINVQVDWANLQMIGYILMGAGAVVFLIGLILLARRRRTEVVTRTEAAPDGSATTRRATSTTAEEDVY